MSDEKVVINIPINDIAPNPYQPRKSFSASSLDELSESIKYYGVLQPINVRKVGSGSYELISGERRLRASKLAGLTTIPAIINEIKEQDSAVLAMIENLQREDLNYLEEAEGYSNLINDHGLTQEELAKRVGKNQSTIANKLRLLKLSTDIKKILLENNLTERHARALLRLPDETIQNKILKEIIKRSLNVKSTEDLIANTLEKLCKDDEKEKVKRNIKGKINYRIYINSIKSSLKKIVGAGCNMQYDQVDKGEFVEITIKVPKNNLT